MAQRSITRRLRLSLIYDIFSSGLSLIRIAHAPMTYQEFQRHVGKAGLTLAEFADLIRMNRISISNLSKRGEVPGHLAIIACLFGEMAERGIEFRSLVERLGLEPRKPRGGAAKGRFGGSRQQDLFIAGKTATGELKGLARKRERSKNIEGLLGAARGQQKD